MSRPAPAWSVVALRVSRGDVPEFGAVLELASGRRYQVVGVRRRALRCLVLPRDAPIEPGTAVWPWAWDKRPRKAKL